MKVGDWVIVHTSAGNTLYGVLKEYNFIGQKWIVEYSHKGEVDWDFFEAHQITLR